MSVSLNINKCFRFGTYTPGGQTGEYNNLPEGMTFLYEPFIYSTGDPSITGYAHKVRHRTTPENLGVSIFNLDDYVTNTGSWKMETATKTLLQDLNLKYTRFYNLRSLSGGVTDGVNRAYYLCNHLNIPTDKVVLSLEHYQESSKPSTQIYTNALTQNKNQGYGFKNWEVANEPYYTNTGVFNPASEYVSYFNSVYTAAKAADSSCKLGLAVQRVSSWAQTVINGCAGKYDFVCPHFYAWNDWRDYPSISGAISPLNKAVLQDYAALNNYTKTVNGSIKPIYETEWRLYSFGAPQVNSQGVDDYDGEYHPRNGNIVGACHEAVRLIYTIQNGLSLAAGNWRLVDNKSQAVLPRGWWYDALYGNGWINLTGKTSVRYWLRYYFSRYMGDYVCTYSGTTRSLTNNVLHNYESSQSTQTFDTTPTLITMSADGTTLYIIAVNASNSTISIDFSINGFELDMPLDGSNISAKLITQSSVDSKWWCDSESDVVSSYNINGGQQFPYLWAESTWNVYETPHEGCAFGTNDFLPYSIIFIKAKGQLKANFEHYPEPQS